MSDVTSLNVVRDETVDYYYYQMLIQRRQRVRAFQSALSSVIRHGDVVTEIGAGLGTYSFFAAQAGARQVYAIESESVINAAQEIAIRNGLDSRITFLRGNSTEILPPEKADVLILEEFSSLFIRRGLEEVVRDGVERYLKQDGIIVPGAVSLHLALVGDEKVWKSCLQLEDDNYSLYGLNLKLLREIMLSSPHVRELEPHALASAPVRFQTIDLKQPQSFLFDEVLPVQVNRPCSIYGIAAWFDLNLTKDIDLRNAPSEPDSTWGQVFFPFSNPLQVSRDESVIVRLACNRSSHTRDIWWTWQASAGTGLADNRSFQGIVFRSDGAVETGHRMKS